MFQVIGQAAAAIIFMLSPRELWWITMPGSIFGIIIIHFLALLSKKD